MIMMEKRNGVVSRIVMIVLSLVTVEEGIRLQDLGRWITGAMGGLCKSL